MALEKIDVPWAETSVNVTEPSDPEKRNGHVLGTTANSDWVNWQGNRGDESLNAAFDMAQSASQAPPIDDKDWLRLCGEMQHQRVNGTLFPDSTKCAGELPTSWADSCVGRVPATNRGCIYYITASADSVYQVNTWDIGNITTEVLDLDLTNISGMTGVACDGDYLYLAVRNTVTDSYHLMKFDLTTWTGLPIEDRDTGWALASDVSNVMMVLARGATIAAFYSVPTTAAFGIWETDDSSWLTGAGNIGGLTGPVSQNLLSDMIHKVQATYNQVYVIVQTSEAGGTYNQLNLVSCDVDDPTTASYPEDPITIDYTSTSDLLCGFRVIGGGRVAILNRAGRVMLIYETGGVWSTLDKGYLSALDIDIETGSTHAPQITADNSGRLWFLYFLENADTVDGSTSLVLVAFDPAMFRQDMTDLPLAYQAIVPVGSYDIYESDSLRLHFDGRSLVVLNNAEDPRYVRILHNPGAR